MIVVMCCLKWISRCVLCVIGVCKVVGNLFDQCVVVFVIELDQVEVVFEWIGQYGDMVLVVFVYWLFEYCFGCDCMY